jgi:hypothetical protein
VDSLHAALWSSTCIPVAGTPLLWWWHLVEEEHLYPMYGAVARFMEKEDRRNPKWLVRQATVGGSTDDIRVQCMSDGSRALGWIHHGAKFEAIDPAGPAVTTNTVLHLDGMAAGRYTAEFWDTRLGLPCATHQVDSQDPSVSVPVPSFARDIAFKLRPDR